MKVENLMTRDVAVCGLEESTNEAARWMWERDCGAVPIVDRRTGELAGILTDRDICMAVYTQGTSPCDIPVSRIMSREVAAVRPDDDIADAHRLMRERRIRRLPVVDEQSKIVGMISLNDLALLALTVGARSPSEKAEVADTLGAVCRRRSESSESTSASFAPPRAPGARPISVGRDATNRFNASA